jgi:hypothetical protein
MRATDTLLLILLFHSKYKIWGLMREIYFTYYVRIGMKSWKRTVTGYETFYIQYFIHTVQMRLGKCLMQIFFSR